MYYLILNDRNPELKDLFPQGVPAYGPAPDEFVEIYDSYTWELIDIQPAFRVNLKGLTKDEELQLFNRYASIMNDPHFIQNSFRLLEKNLEPVPADCVELVAWREGKKSFALNVTKPPQSWDESSTHPSRNNQLAPATQPAPLPCRFRRQELSEVGHWSLGIIALGIIALGIIALGIGLILSFSPHP